MLLSPADGCQRTPGAHSKFAASACQPLANPLCVAGKCCVFAVKCSNQPGSAIMIRSILELGLVVISDEPAL